MKLKPMQTKILLRLERLRYEKCKHKTFCSLSLKWKWNFSSCCRVSRFPHAEKNSHNFELTSPTSLLFLLFVFGFTFERDAFGRNETRKARVPKQTAELKFISAASLSRNINININKNFSFLVFRKTPSVSWIKEAARNVFVNWE